MPLATKNGAIIAKDGKLAENCGCCGCDCIKGFAAFDGSSRRFMYATLIDADTCYFTHPDDRYEGTDGYYVVESTRLCSVGSNSGVVTESYGGYKKYRVATVGMIVTVPTGHGNNSTANSATFTSLVINAGCGNPYGDKIGWQLSQELPPAAPPTDDDCKTGCCSETQATGGSLCCVVPKCRCKASNQTFVAGGTCEAGACCDGTTCSVKPACQCQGTGKTFKGVGTVCAPNPCVACSGCTASHPTYLNITFTQSASISGGFHESLIDLSGTYSVPSVMTGAAACLFSGVFSKTYPSAVVNQFGTFDFEPTFRVSALFATNSNAIAIGLAGASMNGGDVADRSAGLYQFTVCTGVPLGQQAFDRSIPLGDDQMQLFLSCVGNSHAANRHGWTNAPTSSNPYRVNVNSTSVQCGSFSWAKA